MSDKRPQRAVTTPGPPRSTSKPQASSYASATSSSPAGPKTLPRNYTSPSPATPQRPPATPQRPTGRTADTIRTGLTRINEIVADVIWENQRGSAIFGAPKFSAKSLLPTDYPEWSDGFGAYHISLQNTQCLPGWKWVSDWMVDSSGNADPDGWQYNFSFSLPNWSGTPNISHYVRRRKWVRMRERENGGGIPRSPSPQSPSAISNRANALAEKIERSDVIARLHRRRLDREKFLELDQFLKQYPSKQADVAAMTMNILIQFDYECTKLKAAKTLCTFILGQPENIEDMFIPEEVTGSGSSSTPPPKPSRAPLITSAFAKEFDVVELTNTISQAFLYQGNRDDFRRFLDSF
ncbi:hypothetical protein BJ742DRAFT_806304 [Cladochytrium replicatum]|nr:hypothetical protein BJ742DRAFT_806304 [Cladochytrium replicatum]